MFQLSRLSPLIFYTFLTLIFLLEGLGWRGGREAAFALILLMPVSLFLLDVILKKKIVIPKVPTILYGGFIVFSTFSTIFSVDVQRSLPYLLFYMALYGVFLYVYNHKGEIKKYLIPFIFIICFIFLTYSIVANSLIMLNFNFFFPQDGGQYVIRRYGVHNNLGDIVLLPIIASAYSIFMRRFILLNLLSLLFFTPFFLYSYSRSAMISFLITIAGMLVFIKGRGKKYYFSTFVIVIMSVFVSIFFISTVSEFSNIPLVSPLKKQFSETYNILDRPLFRSRLQFFRVGFYSIIENPVVGVGPNNFFYISQQYKNEQDITTDNSHNIFIDIFSENGIIAGIFFLFFIMYLLLYMNKKTVFFFLVIAMLVNFQTHYTFKLYSNLLLFYIVCATIYTNTNDYRGRQKGV